MSEKEPDKIIPPDSESAKRQEPYDLDEITRKVIENIRRDDKGLQTEDLIDRVKEDKEPDELEIESDDPEANPILEENPTPIDPTTGASPTSRERRQDDFIFREDPSLGDDPESRIDPTTGASATSGENPTAEKGPDTAESPKKRFAERAREAYGFVSERTKETFKKLKLPEGAKAKIGSLFGRVKANLLEHIGIVGSKDANSISDKLSGDLYGEFEKVNREIKQCSGEIIDVGLALERLKQAHGVDLESEITSKFAEVEAGHRKTLKDLEKKREGIEMRLGSYDARKGNLERSRREILGEIIERFDDKLQPHNEDLEPIIQTSEELAGLLETARQRRGELAAQCAQEEQNLKNASSAADKIGPEFYLAKARSELAEVNKQFVEYSGKNDKIKEKIYNLRARNRPWQEKRDALAKALKSSEETHGLSDEFDLESPAISGPQVVRMIRRLNYLYGIEKDDGRKEVLEAKKKEIAERILGEIKKTKAGDKVLKQLRSEDVENIRKYGPKRYEDLTLAEQNANNRAILQKEKAIEFIKKKYSIKQDEDAIDLYEALAQFNIPEESVKKEDRAGAEDEKTRILRERKRMIDEQVAILRKASDEIDAELKPRTEPEAPADTPFEEDETEKKARPGQYAMTWNLLVSGKYKINEGKFVSECGYGAPDRPIKELEKTIISYFERDAKKGHKHMRSREFKKGLQDAMDEVRNSL